MTSHDEPRERRDLRLPAHKSAFARYLFAVVATTVGLVITLLLFETDVSDRPIYAPLIGAVVLTAWYGGLGPTAVAILLGWSLSLVLLVDGSVVSGNTDDVTRWWINLAVAIALGVIGGLLRARTERSAVVAVSASTAMREIESLQQMSIALSGALSSSDVAEVVTAHATEVVSAHGSALGLIEGEDLWIVDPSGLATHSRVTLDRLPLSKATLLTQAARDGSIAVAADRSAIDAMYGDSAGLLRREVQGAVALPLRAEGKVIGSIGFLFTTRDAVTAETQAIAGIVADLVGQALERARLYERELESRRALERILQVAPRFLADDPDDVMTAICREARVTFGADYGVLWRIRPDSLELLAIDPVKSEVATGRELPLDDFPMLSEAIRELGTSFVADVLETTRGEGLEFVRGLGIRSSLRTPVVISGASELVLAISWQVIVSEPDPATVAVVRRFADQAGLALEQLERRRAEAEAALRADSTRRLQEVTAALSLAATPLEVSDTCLEHALASIGAEAGFVVLNGPDGTTVDLVTATGFDDAELETWRALGPDDDVPFARAMASGEADLGPLARRHVRVHRVGGGPLGGLGHIAADDAVRCARCAAHLAANTASRQRRGAGVAPVDGVAVRASPRAKRNVRRGTALAPARGTSSGNDCAPVERPHSSRRREGRRGRSERRGRGFGSGPRHGRRRPGHGHPDAKRRWRGRDERRLGADRDPARRRQSECACRSVSPVDPARIGQWARG